MPPPGAGDGAERLNAAEAELDQLHPPPPPPPPPAQAEIGDRLKDEAGQAEILDQLGQLAEEPGELPKFTQAELADFIETGFDVLAEIRHGDHWKLPRPAAERIAKWAKKCLDQVGTVPAWVLKLIPWLITTALLAQAVKGRLDRDRELKGSAEPGGAAA